VEDIGAPESSASPMLTTRDGAFSVTQSERGRRIYNNFCVSCHPVEFYETQLLVWQDVPISEFVDALSATMPAESPGVLAMSQYLDVTAYILSITGSPAGDEELTLDSAAAVRIVND
jgi:mono/diheme cytochrome c family protein